MDSQADIVGIARDLNAAATIIAGCAARLAAAVSGDRDAGPSEPGPDRPDPRAEGFQAEPDEPRYGGPPPPNAAANPDFPFRRDTASNTDTGTFEN